MPGVLIVDDDPALRSWAKRILTEQSYDCDVAANADGAREALATERFEVVLLDVNMPGESGIELLGHLRVEYPTVAVLMVTGEELPRACHGRNRTRRLRLSRQAGSAGRAADQCYERVAPAPPRSRAAPALRTARGRRRRHRQGALRHALEASELAPDIALAFQSDTMRRLLRLAEFRDDQTGQHMFRMGRYCELLALQLGLAEECCDSGLAGELHDIGKVGIADRILLKPGRLTVTEYRVMRTHAEIGHGLLADSSAELMKLAASVALSHHEHWGRQGLPTRSVRREHPARRTYRSRRRRLRRAHERPGLQAGVPGRTRRQHDGS